MGKINDILLDNDLEGTAFFNDDYDTAILGYTEDRRLVYSYEKMCEWLVEKADMSYSEACEWVDYNVVRSIPYMGEKSPIIVYNLIF